MFLVTRVESSAAVWFPPLRRLAYTLECDVLQNVYRPLAGWLLAIEYLLTPYPIIFHWKLSKIEVEKESHRSAVRGVVFCCLFAVVFFFSFFVCTWCVRVYILCKIRTQCRNSSGCSYEQSELFIHCFQNHFLSAVVEASKGAYKCGVNV